MIMAKPRYLPPKIITPLNEVRIKCGLIFHTDIHFIGEPAPEATWTLNSNPLLSNDRSTITSIGHHSVVHTVNCQGLTPESTTYYFVIVLESMKAASNL